MAQITKQQFADIVAGAPQGTDPKEIMNGLLQRGHSLEGYVPESTQSVPAPSSMWDKISSNTNENSSLGEKVRSVFNPINQARQFVKGAASTFAGMAGLATKGAEKLGIPQTPNQALETTKQWAEPKGVQDYVNPGRIAETVGEFAQPEALAMKGAKVANAVIDTASKVPNFLKAGAKIATKMTAAGAAGGVVGAAETGDISQADPTKLGSTAQISALIPGAGNVIGAAKRSIQGTLAENVGKAVGMTGKMNTASALEAIPKATRALETLYNEAKGTVVKDVDGIEKVFEPVKATFGETLQALKTSKDNIYNGYSELANQAGDTGANFSKNDFMGVINGLKGMAKNATGATKSKVNGLIQDIIDNYATVTDGKVKFNDTALSDIQSFIEDINKDVNPLTNKAGAEVSGKASQLFREMMDSKIANAKGAGYQELRNKYADLKSIENGLINQFKKQSRGVGSGVADWVHGFGNLDTVVGLITANPAQAVKGVGMNILSRIVKNLRSPETKLQKVFQEIEKGSSVGSDVKNFLMGEKGKPLTQGEQKLVGKIQGKLKEGIPAGMSIKDVSKISQPLQEGLSKTQITDTMRDAVHTDVKQYIKFIEKKLGEGKLGVEKYTQMDKRMENLKKVLKRIEDKKFTQEQYIKLQKYIDKFKK